MTITFVPMTNVQKEVVFTLLSSVMMTTNVPMILAVKKLANVNILPSFVMITTNVLRITATHPVGVCLLMSLAKKRIVRKYNVINMKDVFMKIKNVTIMMHVLLILAITLLEAVLLHHFPVMILTHVPQIAAL